MSITQIGLSGLRASQAGLNMSARNTANLQTEGYSRQGVSLVADARGGVQVASLVRYADSYRSQQLWGAQSREGQYSVQGSYYSELESVMGLGEGSVGSGIDAFFAALDEVSTDPTSVALRQQVISSASSVALRFNSLRDTLQGQLDTVARQADSMATQINSLSSTVADLNARISQAAAIGASTSELMDQRDLAVGQLASLADVRVTTQADGAYGISLKNGAPLVVGARSATVTATTGSDGGLEIAVQLGDARYPLADGAIGGQLGGLDAYARSVVQQKASAATIAGELSDRVNAALTAGYGTDGQPGQALFAFDAATGTMSINTGLTQASLGLSAAADEPGNSDQLAALLDVRTQDVTLPGLGNVSLGDAYTLMVGRLGSESSINQASLDTAATLRQQAQLSLESVRGVSSEEEAVNISELMQAYQANMKVISVATELFQTTLDAL